jgi:hypothetical protein
MDEVFLDFFSSTFNASVGEFHLHGARAETNFWNLTQIGLESN